MHSASVGTGEDIIGQSATRGSLLLSIRSLYQSYISENMNAILPGLWCLYTLASYGFTRNQTSALAFTEMCAPLTTISA